jgi:hypothetical protein
MLPELHREYIRRMQLQFGIRAAVVDLGVTAGPEPRTNACQFLAVVAACSRIPHFLDLVQDAALKELLSLHWEGVLHTPSDLLQRSYRTSPRLDPVGHAADALRSFICRHMRMPATRLRYMDAFAPMDGSSSTLASYDSHWERVETVAFGDHLTLQETVGGNRLQS